MKKIQPWIYTISGLHQVLLCSIAHGLSQSDNWKHLINKRPKGHIAHLRNHFKSMNTFERSYDYIHVYYKTGLVVQKEKIFKFCESIFATICYYLPM